MRRKGTAAGESVNSFWIIGSVLAYRGVGRCDGRLARMGCRSAGLPPPTVGAESRDRSLKLRGVWGFRACARLQSFQLTM